MVIKVPIKKIQTVFWKSAKRDGNWAIKQKVIPKMKKQDAHFNITLIKESARLAAQTFLKKTKLEKSEQKRATNLIEKYFVLRAKGKDPRTSVELRLLMSQLESFFSKDEAIRVIREIRKIQIEVRREMADLHKKDIHII